eukprot:CAMPEP_0113641104 /NCGR_PEP_ID=MMETSP0017_2-20120614/21577_1 /TAXON_ID=2856 /ORGANISM="Cylindrotheca closterium" /LENGTH=299 /DNA_ID=CAMNT_0000552427 /DNA_START=105 /DNA_END=1004 /DNA_ORIENTATION=+ /assembly_acc=CAM_ASM_000147
MKRKLNQSQSEASASTTVNDVNDCGLRLHEQQQWAHKRIASPSHCNTSSSSSSILSSPPTMRLPLLSPTRPVSPDPSRQYHTGNQQLVFDQQPPFGSKVVRFANPLVEIREISRAWCSTEASDVPKSALYYSKHDYMKFYVRERSRLAFQDLTKRICREQERRMRNRIRVIPSHFVALNFLNAVMTINELGQQVKKQQQQQQHSAQQQQQQQFALFRRRKRRRRSRLVEPSSSQQDGHHPVAVVAVATNNRSTSSASSSRSRSSNSMPNHSNLRRHASISLNQVKPRPPRRNTVCAAVA